MTVKDERNPGDDQTMVADPTNADLIKQLDEETISFDDIDPAKKKELLFEMSKEPEEEKTEPEITPEPEKETEKEPEKVEKEVEKEATPEEEKSAPKSKKDLKKELKDQADLVNKYKQIANSATLAKEKYLKDHEEAMKNVTVDDKLNPDPSGAEEHTEFVKETRLAIAGLKAENTFLNNKLQERGNTDLADATENLKQTETQKAFTAMEDVQDDFAHLATSKSIETMNDENAQFLDGLVTVSGLKDHEDYKTKDNQELRDVALQMYEKDPVFRKDATDKGVNALDWSDKDRENYDLMVNFYRKSQSEGGTIREKVLGHLDSSGTLLESINKGRKEALIEGSNKAANAIENKSPNTLDPSDGAGTNPNEKGEFTLETVGNVITTLKEKAERGNLSKEEQVQMKEALDFVMKSTSE